MFQKLTVRHLSLPFAALLASQTGTAQTAVPASIDSVTAGAYSGLFRMPTPDVLGDGNMSLGWSSGPAARKTDHPIAQISRADNYFANVGFLPGLEFGASFLVPAPFNGELRDRAISAKYELLTEAKYGVSLAVGSTDLYGTSLRQSNYIVAGKGLGAFQAYVGVSEGLLRTGMEGISYNFSKDFAAVAEDAGGKGSIGLKGILANRFSGALSVDSDHELFMGVGYSFPLKSPADRVESEVTPKSMTSVDPNQARSKIAKALSQVRAGVAEVEEIDGDLVVRYEDVDARDPVATLGHVLKICAEAASQDTHKLTVVVRRFGFDLVSISAPLEKVKAFVTGYLTSAEFLEAAWIEDEGPNRQPQDSADRMDGEKVSRQGKSPAALVTLAPAIGYSLGVKNVFPNKESVDGKAIVPLPGQLFAVGTAEANLNDSLDRDRAVDQFGLGLYRADRLSEGVWTMVGVDHVPQDPTEASLQLSYYPPDNPFYLTGSVAKPFAGRGDKRLRYASEGGVSALRGTLTLWGRYERFEAGDIGETLGMTRKFDQTWLIVSAIRTHDNSLEPLDKVSSLTKVGVTFQIPLPDIGAKVGPVRVASDTTADFGYHAIEHDYGAFGRAVVHRNLLTSDQDLQARAQLSTWFIRLQIDQLRNAARGK